VQLVLILQYQVRRVLLEPLVQQVFKVFKGFRVFKVLLVQQE
jgi:hypothetical protein